MLSSADTFSLRNSAEVPPTAVRYAQVLVPAPLCNEMEVVDDFLYPRER